MKSKSSANDTENQSVASPQAQWVARHLPHPVVARYQGPNAPFGIRCANAITGFMGSWVFLWVQTLLVAAWITLNIVAWRRHFDPYPFILLNLAFSTQAAYAAPLILMAGNVSAARDRELWENDYATNQRAYQKIEALEEQVRSLAEQNNAMLRQSQEVLAMLVLQKQSSAASQNEASSPVETLPQTPRVLAGTNARDEY
jgi:uncharacterized membrane protein